MLGFAGKASAQYMNYQVYTLFYREGEPVTVLVACDYGWHIGYTLSGGALSAYRAPGIYAVASANNASTIGEQSSTCGNGGETIHLGALGAGTYTIFVFGALPNGVLLLYQNFIANIVYTMTVGELYTANLFDNYGITGSGGEGNYELLGTNGYYSKTFDVCVADVFKTCTAESLPNTCGQTASNTGTIRCNGSCSAYAPSTPSNPSYYQNSCQLTSARNACGQTKTANVGTFDCDGTCVGTRPAVPPVTVPPAAPSVSGPSRAPAWNEAGYPVNATGAACNNTSVTQYFEFSRDGVNWTGDNPGFPPSSWATLP